VAASQRDISVSEFFAKTGICSDSTILARPCLTTIKEAVDNSLDACEEAGILPEIWVHVEQTGTNRLKSASKTTARAFSRKQIPLIFGKLLYGSKFHRLRMSRGQQGIGISAAGMYGVLTTGKPVKIVSRDLAAKAGPLLRDQNRHEEKPARNPHGNGEGVDIPPGEAGTKYIQKQWHRVDRAGSWHARDDRARRTLYSRARKCR